MREKVNDLFKHFLVEARDNLEKITDNVIQLEARPNDASILEELFRIVHTLKGSSGLFDLPEVTNLLHSCEDLMSAVRDGQISFAPELVDVFLDAMDLVGAMLQDVEQNGEVTPEHREKAVQATWDLKQLRGSEESSDEKHTEEPALPADEGDTISALESAINLPLAEVESIPEPARMEAYRRLRERKPVVLATYQPEESAFFKGEDPFLLARRLPGIIWASVDLRDTGEELADFDCYTCKLTFYFLASASRDVVAEHFRYVPDQIRLQTLDPRQLVVPVGVERKSDLDDFCAETLAALLGDGRLDSLKASVQDLLKTAAPDTKQASLLRWILVVVDSSPEDRDLLRELILQLGPPQMEERAEQIEKSRSRERLNVSKSQAPSDEADCSDLLREVIEAQRKVLELPDDVDWLPGRIAACGAALRGCLQSLGLETDQLEEAVARALAQNSSVPLREWVKKLEKDFCSSNVDVGASEQQHQARPQSSLKKGLPREAETGKAPSPTSTPPKAERQSLAMSSNVLKVGQGKIDRLMGLIGELVVAKNALPYLASKAEDEYGVRAFAQEIKSHYNVIDRIAKDLQDTILQVRMVPVGLVFQRFPRLVRDISRKLGKQVELSLKGEETEIDKTVVDAISEPLVHLIRNSLDHGIEAPEQRANAGKSEIGHLVVSAYPQGDRVVIEISDDGQGIDPDVVRKKAYATGVVSEEQLERMGDEEALQLIFLPGFSTADQVTDLSGRGVGMDAVRKAVTHVGGSVSVSSEVGRGTTVRLFLPLTVAVTNVMILQSGGQRFGVPVDKIAETNRIAADAIYTVNGHSLTRVRGKVVPVFSLNELLGIERPQVSSEENELAVLVVQAGGRIFALIVDEFLGSTDVVLKPMPAGFTELPVYAGTALLGDGSLLLVLNTEGLLSWESNSVIAPQNS